MWALQTKWMFISCMRQVAEGELNSSGSLSTFFPSGHTGLIRRDYDEDTFSWTQFEVNLKSI